MREFKNEQIVFYCNCVGELHKGGKEDLKSVEELPLPLQSVYETLWTDNLSAPCYIAYVDGRPGLLVAAEYNEEECKLQDIAHEHDEQYAALKTRCERMELLVRSVNARAEVGIGTDTGFDLEMILFIPTESVSPVEVLQLYFLMDEYAFSLPPETVHWETEKLMALAKRCLPPSFLNDILIEKLGEQK